MMDIGKMLQDARIAKNLSLDTVAQETNIRKVYLEAIEQNDFTSLPGVVFVKGIIRTYGNYLGLDGTRLVEEYKAADTGVAFVKNNNEIRESQHVKVRPTFTSNSDIGSGSAAGHQKRVLIAIVIAVLLAITAGSYFYQKQTGTKNSLLLILENFIPQKAWAVLQEIKDISEAKTGEMKGKEKKIPETEKGENPGKFSAKAEETGFTSGNSSKPESVQATSETSMATEHGTTALKIMSTGRCWLRVTDEKGTELFQGVLRKGESKNFSSNSKIIMRIGNLKDLQIEHNGKVLPFEETYEVVTRTYGPRTEVSR